MSQAKKKDAISGIVEEVLDGTEHKLRLDSYTLEENLETGGVVVTCSVHDSHTGEELVLAGKGVGLVDATFRAYRDRYADEFPSLSHITFAEFSIRAEIDRSSAPSAAAPNTDSNATVCLSVLNETGKLWEFSESSPSLSRSSIKVVMEAVSFFINAERAFITTRKALAYSKENRRHDSAERYTRYLSQLVEATSYSDIV